MGNVGPAGDKPGDGSGHGGGDQGPGMGWGTGTEGQKPGAEGGSLVIGAGRDRAHRGMGGPWAGRILPSSFSGGMGFRVTAAMYSLNGLPSHF